MLSIALHKMVARDVAYCSSDRTTCSERMHELIKARAGQGTCGSRGVGEQHVPSAWRYCQMLGVSALPPAHQCRMQLLCAFPAISVRSRHRHVIAYSAMSASAVSGSAGGRALASRLASWPARMPSISSSVRAWAIVQAAYVRSHLLSLHSQSSEMSSSFRV